MRTQKQHKQMKNDYKLDPMDARAVAWFLNQEEPEIQKQHKDFIVTAGGSFGAAYGDSPIDAIVFLYEQEVLEPARRQMDKEGEA